MSNKKLKDEIAYDLDGVLFDAEELSRQYFRCTKKMWYSFCIGRTIDKIVQILRPTYNEDAIKWTVKSYEDYLINNLDSCLGNTTLISQIQGNKHGVIVTTRPKTVAKKICKYLGIDEYIKGYFCDNNKRVAIDKACEKFNIYCAYEDDPQWLCFWEAKLGYGRDVICVRTRGRKGADWRPRIFFDTRKT